MKRTDPSTKRAVSDAKALEQVLDVLDLYSEDTPALETRLEYLKRLAQWHHSRDQKGETQGVYHFSHPDFVTRTDWDKPAATI